MWRICEKFYLCMGFSINLTARIIFQCLVFRINFFFSSRFITKCRWLYYLFILKNLGGKVSHCNFCNIHIVWVNIKFYTCIKISFLGSKSYNKKCSFLSFFLLTLDSIQFLHVIEITVLIFVRYFKQSNSKMIYCQGVYSKLLFIQHYGCDHIMRIFYRLK